MPGLVPVAEPLCFGKSSQTAVPLLETHYAKGRPVRPHRRGRTRATEERANSHGSNKAHREIRASLPGAGRQASKWEGKKGAEGD